MRVNDTDPTPSTDVLTDRVEKKRALPHAGFTDDIRMVPAIGQGKEEGILPSISVAYAEADVFVIFHAQANRHSERLLPLTQSVHLSFTLVRVWRQTFLASRQGNSGLLRKPISPPISSLFIISFGGAERHCA